MERKLASIQIISSLDLIYNADRIVMATVLGWNVIVKKDEFKVGDKCIFLEIDSVLPDGYEWSEFMRPYNFRVKTCKLRGVLSQGLILPINILPNENNYSVGDDVSEILKIKKFEQKKDFKLGDSCGNFPLFISKTDEIRLQSILPVLDEIKDVPVYWTVKCDGTSSTFYKMDNEFFACSRNFKKKCGNNVFWDIVIKYKLQECLPDGIAIQGEICGPSIQKNRLMLSEVDLFVFDVFNIKTRKYFGLEELIQFCSQNNLKTVPIEGVIYNPNYFNISLDTWLKRARGLYNGTNNNREGIVVRTVTPIYSNILKKRLSFKVLNNDFLLKDEE